MTGENFPFFYRKPIPNPDKLYFIILVILFIFGLWKLLTLLRKSSCVIVAGKPL